ncbi:MAG: preprotein translocase subunit SecE [Solirubrobacteraceae bacterium]
MARNRKRTRDRRPRRPDDGAGRAIIGGTDFDPVPDFDMAPGLDAAPDPLLHASPDTELAEAQLALGRADLDQSVSDDDDFESFQDEHEFEELEDAVDEQLDFTDRGPAGLPAGAGRGSSGGRSPASSGAGGGEVAVPSGAAVEPPGAFTRLVTFLQGSWRELQRVQWPDRRQVMQATGVVLGFVIVAGVYLGVADYLAQKIVHFILTK